MLGTLPTTLDIGGKPYAIRADYRNILRIFSAFNADELTDQEKALVCLRRLFVDVGRIPTTQIREAYDAAISFIECGNRPNKPQPKLVDWDKDEQLIFAAVNKVAGQEIRAVPFLHWWTFLGYFQTIDRDDTWGFILTIRQKKARHKKLEKHENDFFNANRDICDLNVGRDRKKEADDYLSQLQQKLLNGQR